MEAGMKAIGWLIVVSSLLITIPRYTMAFSSVDDSQLTAVGMGILLGVGAAYIFHAWARAHTTTRKNTWMLVVAFCVNLLYEPFIIAPLVMARLHGWTLAETMGTGYSVFWSIAVAAAPVVLSPGIMLAVSFQREKRTGRTGRTGKEQNAEQAESGTESPTSVSESEQAFVCPVCARSYQSQKALAGHMNAHRPKELVT